MRLFNRYNDNGTIDFPGDSHLIRPEGYVECSTLTGAILFSLILLLLFRTPCLWPLSIGYSVATCVLLSFLLLAGLFRYRGVSGTARSIAQQHLMQAGTALTLLLPEEVLHLSQYQTSPTLPDRTGRRQGVKSVVDFDW